MRDKKLSWKTVDTIKGRALVLALVLASLSAAARLRSAPAARQPKQAPTTVPQFRFDLSWPKQLPNHWALGNVVGVAVDARDHIWIVHRPATLTDFERSAALVPPAAECCAAAPPVIEFDQGGNLVQAWGGPGEGYEWPLSDPVAPPNQYTSRNPQGEHSLFVDHADHVWVGSNGPKGTHILKFTRDGKFLLQIGHRGENHGSNDTENLGGPAGIVVDPKANEVYVADGYVNRRVIVFDADTKVYRRHWGAYGNRPVDGPLRYDPDGPPAKQFSTVHCVRISHDGLVYVCDRANDRIQVFQRDGTFVKESFVARRTIPNPGSVQDIGFSPDPEQRFLYVADGANEKVWILRRSDLEVIGSFGSGGHFAGQFIMAHSMAVDSKGNIYVGESLDGKRVQRFTYTGLAR